MSLNTCLADLEAQGVLVVLVLNRLMKTFSKQSVAKFEEYYKKMLFRSFQIIIINDVFDNSAIGHVVSTN